MTATILPELIHSHIGTFYLILPPIRCKNFFDCVVKPSLGPILANYRNQQSFPVIHGKIDARD